MAGPKTSSSGHGPTKAQQQQQDKPESSYKDKLMAPSSHDDLSAPDKDQEKPKLPPVQDAGSPPMVPGTPAGPTGSGTSTDEPHSTTKALGPDEEGFTPVGKAAAQAGDGPGGDDQGPTDTGKTDTGPPLSPSVTSAPGPSPLASTAATLSDVDQQAVTDPSTADLVAAATGATPSETPAVNESAPQMAPGGAVLATPLPDSPDNQLAKGGSSGSSGGGSAAAEGGSSGQGAQGASSGAAAAGGAAGGDSSRDSGDVSLPTPAAAAKMAGGDEVASPGASAEDDERAKAAAAEELPEKGREGATITPADFAATGLAALEAEADAAAGGSGGGGGSSSQADRSASVMTDRTDSGWYDRSYSGVLGHTSAAYLAGMDPVSEKGEESEGQQQMGEQSEAAGPPQGYPALAQAPAASGDAAAEPAPPQPAASAKGPFAAAAATADGDDSSSRQPQSGDDHKPLPLAETTAPLAGMGSGKESGRGNVTIPESADTGDESPSEANPPAAAAASSADAPAGEQKSEGMELPFPLKAAGDAAKAMIDVVGDAAEAVKDTLIGTDV